MRIKTAVLIADGVPDDIGDRILKENVRLPESCRVRVLFDNEEEIGECVLEWDGNVLTAEMDVPGFVPENLEGKWPSVRGKVLYRDDDIEQWEISAVSIGKKNVDGRIEPLPVSSGGSPSVPG